MSKHKFAIGQYVNFSLKGRTIEVHACVKDRLLNEKGEPMYYVYNAGADTFKYTLIAESQIVAAFIKNEILLTSSSSSSSNTQPSTAQTVGKAARKAKAASTAA